MKTSFVCSSLALLLSLAVVPSAMAKKGNLETFEQKLGYTIGVDFGTSMKENIPELDLDALMAGLEDAFNGKEIVLSDEDRESIRQESMKRMQEKARARWQEQLEANLAKGTAFLEKNGKKKGVATTDSGLQYEVLKKGKGDAPGPKDKVTVHYSGTLLDGTEFDSSYARNEPVTFPLNSVIPGWTEGLQLMKPGAKYKLYIPAKLAYGPRGTQNGAIGPNETLVFEVELLEVEKADVAAK